MSYKSTRPVSVNKSKGHCWWTGCAWPILLVFCLLQVFFVIYYLILCYLPREGLLMERNNIRFIYSCSICYRRQYKHGITHFCHLISLSAALYNLIHEQVLPNNIKSDKRCRNNLHRPTHVKIQIKIPIKFRIYTKPDNTSSSYYLLPTVSLTFPWSRIKYYKLKCISSDNNFPNTHFTKAHFFTKGLNRFYVFFFFFVPGSESSVFLVGSHTHLSVCLICRLWFLRRRKETKTPSTFTSSSSAPGRHRIQWVSLWKRHHFRRLILIRGYIWISKIMKKYRS